MIVIQAGRTENAADAATIFAVDDAIDEPDRRVTVTGTMANDQGAGGVTGAALTMTDDEAAPGGNAGGDAGVDCGSRRGWRR